MSRDIPIPLPMPDDGNVIREPHKDTLLSTPALWQAPGVSARGLVARYVQRHHRQEMDPVPRVIREMYLRRRRDQER